MKVLTIEDVRKQLTFSVNYGMADITLNRVLDDKFDMDVFLPSKGLNLQRPLVWTDLQKKSLIYSVFKGLKIPPISVLKHFIEGKDYVYQVIDGKQRLSTIISFINGEFSVEWEGNEYYFNDLHSYLQSYFYHCISANIGYDYPDKRVSDNQKIEWFDMINFSGTPQEFEHINNLKSIVMNS